jgi:hypothetical protein
MQKLQLACQVEGDEQTVDDERLDERQGDDHGDEDLARSLRIASNAVESRRSAASPMASAAPMPIKPLELSAAAGAAP